MSLILLFWSLELSLLCLKFLQYGNCGTDQPYAIISNVFSAINILLALLGLSPVHSDTICVNISLNHKLHSAWNASLLVNHHMRIKNRFSKKKLSYKFTNSNWINNQRDAKTKRKPLVPLAVPEGSACYDIDLCWVILILKLNLWIVVWFTFYSNADLLLIIAALCNKSFLRFLWLKVLQPKR